MSNDTTQMTPQSTEGEVPVEDVGRYIEDCIRFAHHCEQTVGAFERVMELEGLESPQFLTEVAKNVAHDSMLGTMDIALAFVKVYYPNLLTALAQAESLESFLADRSDLAGIETEEDNNV